MRRIAGSLVALAIGCSGPGGEPAWSVVHEDLPGALMSVWGTSSADVWAVGADAGDGPTVLHHDGERWNELATGTTGHLWWVHGFEGGPVFLGGSGGTILRYQGGAFEEMTTPGGTTVFGIWGTTPDDVWAVGGSEGGSGGGFAWRFDGSAWTEVELPEGVSESYPVWKVWGRAADDVWMVGGGGLILHWDGESITQVPSPTTRTLLTVHASAGRLAAVGGFGTGVLIESDGAEWVDVAPPEAVQLMGVCLDDTDGYAVGIDGAVMRRRGDEWVTEPTGLFVIEQLHAVWIDPDGGVWAVGGNVVAEPLVRGVMLYKGRLRL